MKKATIIFLLLGAFTFGTASAQTQTKEGATKTTTTTSKEDSKSTTKHDKMDDRISSDVQQRAREMTQKLDEVLNLTPDQEKKAMEINLRYLNKLEDFKQKAHDSGNMDRDKIKSQRDDLTRQRLNEYKSFLTKEQWAKFEAHRNNLKDDDKMSKDEKKEKMENMTPEERERMKEKRKD